MYSPVFLSRPITSGSPPVLSISLSDRSFSVLVSSFACTFGHSRPLWRFMFFSKRAFNSLSSSSRCPGDNSFLLLLGLFILASIYRSDANRLLKCCRVGTMSRRVSYGPHELQIRHSTSAQKPWLHDFRRGRTGAWNRREHGGLQCCAHAVLCSAGLFATCG